MNESILTSVKKILGLDERNTDFDEDLVMHTNTVLSILNQMGFGREGFYITGSNERWNEFILADEVGIHAIKSWVGLKVRMLFDPPTSGTLAEAINANLKELEWRIYINKNFVVPTNVPTPYDSKKYIDAHLYEMEYTELDYANAYKYFSSQHDIAGGRGCSFVRSLFTAARNFDWTYNDLPSFIVHGKPREGHQFIGVSGQIDGLTRSIVESDDANELYKIIPFMLVDGINDYGVFCCTNVVPNDKGITTGTTPLVSTRLSICDLMLPMYVLHAFDTATDAINYISNYISIYNPDKLTKMGYQVHIIIADSEKTYCLEFIENELVIEDITEKPYITNFHINGTVFNQDGKVYTPADVPDGHLPSEENHITENGSGLERYNLIVENYGQIESTGMKKMLEDLRYTKSYKLIDPIWYTEFVGIDGMTVDNTPDEYEAIAAPTSRLKFENRSRATGKTWESTHSSIYDMNTNKLTLYFEENFDTKYTFSI